MLFFQLLLLMLCLVVIGEPLRIVFSRYSGLFRKLDILQILTLDVYLGGLILYAIAIVPLHLYSEITVWIITIASGILSALLHLKLGSIKKNAHLDYSLMCKGVVVVAMFLIVLWIGVTPISNFTFGNVHDSSLFGLLVQVIMENKQVPGNLAPHELSGIIYPQAFFVKLTYACYLLGFSPAEVSLLVTPLFQALPVLGGYYLGRTLSPKGHLDLSFAFVFSFFSRWPRLLAWGSNAFVGGFAFYLICLSLLPSLFNLRSQNGRKQPIILMIGILFGYLAAIHIAFYEVLFVSAALMLLFNFLNQHDQAGFFLRNFLAMLISSIIPVSVFIYRFVAYYPHPGHNIGLPPDVITSEPLSLNVNMKLLGWGLFKADWLSPYPPLKFEILALIIISGIGVFLARKSQQFLLAKTALGIVFASLASQVILIILGSSELGLAFLWQVIDPERQALLLLTSLYLLIGIFNVLLHSGFTVFLNSRFKVKRAFARVLGNITKKGLSPTNIKVIAIVSLLFSFIYLPFVYYSLTCDVDYLTGQYGLFCVTSQDDYELMAWMRDKLPKNATILISPFDAGGFIPCVSHHRVIYPFTGSRTSASYERLIWHLRRNNLNATAYNLIKHFNVSHIFIGSQAIYTLGLTFLGRCRWDSQLLLTNPNFKLAKNIGNAYLFTFTYTDPNMFFFDDFEYTNLTKAGWHFELSFRGNGTGNASINTDQQHVFSGNSSLLITANPQLDSFFLTRLWRKIHIPEPHKNVILSFSLKADKGFQDHEGFTIIISDEKWEHKLEFSTYRRGFRLSKSQVFFEINISKVWYENYESRLPSPFFFELEVYDTDGIANTYYIDCIFMRIED